MMITHQDQAEKRPPVLVGEIDMTPELYRLFAAQRLSGRVANVLIGLGRVRTIGLACRRGRRWLKSLPGIGPAGLAEIESLAAEIGVEVAP